MYLADNTHLSCVIHLSPSFRSEHNMKKIRFIWAKQWGEETWSDWLAIGRMAWN